jgi:hypothetical protein
MEETHDDYFIRSNESAILSHPTVLAETKRIGGDKWTLQVITHIFHKKRHIEFGFLLVNDSGTGNAGSVSATANIDRESHKISKVKIREG